jgi:hypothetical protein
MRGDHKEGVGGSSLAAGACRVANWLANWVFTAGMFASVGAGLLGVKNEDMTLGLGGLEKLLCPKPRPLSLLSESPTGELGVSFSELKTPCMEGRLAKDESSRNDPVFLAIKPVLGCVGKLLFIDVKLDGGSNDRKAEGGSIGLGSLSFGKLPIVHSPKLGPFPEG